MQPPRVAHTQTPAEVDRAERVYRLQVALRSASMGADSVAVAEARLRLASVLSLRVEDHGAAREELARAAAVMDAAPDGVAPAALRAELLRARVALTSKATEALALTAEGEDDELRAAALVRLGRAADANNLLVEAMRDDDGLVRTTQLELGMGAARLAMGDRSMDTMLLASRAQSALFKAELTSSPEFAAAELLHGRFRIGVNGGVNTLGAMSRVKRTTGRTPETAAAQLQAADALLQNGRYPQAHAVLVDAIAMLRATAPLRAEGLPSALALLCTVLRPYPELEAVLNEAWDEALGLLQRDGGFPGEQAAVLAAVRLARARPERAAEALAVADAALAARDDGDTLFEPVSWLELAQARLALGDAKRAVADAVQAARRVGVLPEHGDLTLSAVRTFHKALVRDQVGDSVPAEVLHVAALSLPQPDPDQLGPALDALARMGAEQLTQTRLQLLQRQRAACGSEAEYGLAGKYARRCFECEVDVHSAGDAAVFTAGPGAYACALCGPRLGERWRRVRRVFPDAHNTEALQAVHFGQACASCGATPVVGIVHAGDLCSLCVPPTHEGSDSGDRADRARFVTSTEPRAAADAAVEADPARAAQRERELDVQLMTGGPAAIHEAVALCYALERRTLRDTGELQHQAQAGEPAGDDYASMTAHAAINAYLHNLGRDAASPLPDLPDPTQYRAQVKFWNGGTDPIDFCTCLPVDAHGATPRHWLYVSLGYSDLYGDARRTWHGAGGQGPDGDSGLGFEFTMRIARDDDDHEAIGPVWPFMLMQRLARYMHKARTLVDLFDHVPSMIERPEDPGWTASTVVVQPDPLLEPLQTATGRLEFRTLVGLSAADAALGTAWSNRLFVPLLVERGLLDPEMVTRTHAPPCAERDPGLRAAVDAGVARDGSALSGMNGHVTIDTVAEPDCPVGTLELRVDRDAAAALATGLRGRILHGNAFMLTGVGDCHIFFHPDAPIGPPFERIPRRANPAMPLWCLDRGLFAVCVRVEDAEAVAAALSDVGAALPTVVEIVAPEGLVVRVVASVPDE